MNGSEHTVHAEYCNIAIGELPFVARSQILQYKFVPRNRFGIGFQ